MLFLGPASSILAAYGVPVDDVPFRGKFAFVAEKGFPEKTVMAKGIPGPAGVRGEDQRSTARFVVENVN